MATKFRHIVMMTFKPTVSDEKRAEIEQAFASLYDSIDEIVDFEWGTDASVEGRARGLTHVFLVTFKNAAGRDAYLPHPKHQEFVGTVREHIEDVLIFDYEARG